MFASSQGAVQQLNTLNAVVIKESASAIWVWVPPLHCNLHLGAASTGLSWIDSPGFGGLYLL